MSEQFNMPLYTRARVDDRATSVAAAADNAERSATHRWKVLELHYRSERHGLTDEKLGEVGGCRTSSYRTRRDEMGAELIADSGHRTLTRAGDEAIVWRITELGKEIYETGDERVLSGYLKQKRAKGGIEVEMDDL